MSKELDDLILEGLRTRDEAVFNEFFHRHYQPTALFVKRLIKDPVDAYTVTTEAFVKFWLIAPKDEPFPSISHAVAYLRTTAKNLALSHIGSQKKYRTVDLPLEDLTNFPDTPQITWETEMYLKIHEAIQALPKNSREVLVRIYEQKMTLIEVARELGIAYDAAQKRKIRAEQLVIQKIRKGIYLVLFFKIIIITLIYLWKELGHNI